MNYAEAARKTAALKRTENGALALNTTGSKLLDLYGSIGGLRNQDEERIIRLFADAYAEDPLLATKIVFYARDIRGGLGERRIFRILIHYMAEMHPEALRPNIHLIGEYGRYDDLYTLIDTPLAEDMWAVMKKQFEEDLRNMHAGKPISLLAKWIKTADASSKHTRWLGCLTAAKLGYEVYNFKRIVRAMRKHIDIVERKMSAKEWSEIDYPAVPGRAMMLYRKAFGKHDPVRYSAYINKAVKGEAKINSSTLYPYDIIERICTGGWGGSAVVKNDMTLEAQWRQLPNYVEPGTNAMVIADTSGSMMGRPLATAVGLAIYFAERNTGPYHNLWMSFSRNPRFHEVKGETLRQKLISLDMSDWTQNTNLEAAFWLVLDTAVRNDIPKEELPKSLVVISDMEIDACADRDWLFYDYIEREYTKHGYSVPNIIFWNVESRHDTFHADARRKGVQVCSGQSASVFKQVMDCVGMTPVEAMCKVLCGKRYAAITVEE